MGVTPRSPTYEVIVLDVRKYGSIIDYFYRPLRFDFELLFRNIPILTEQVTLAPNTQNYNSRSRNHQSENHSVSEAISISK